MNVNIIVKSNLDKLDLPNKINGTNLRATAKSWALSVSNIGNKYIIFHFLNH